MSVKFTDLAALHAPIRANIDSAIARVVDSGWFILGREVTSFEDRFAAYCGAAHCIGVANGLDALHLSLKALGVGPGDEVIVASNTYIANWLSVTMAGAALVPVEPDSATHNLDPAKVEAAITSKTRVIMPTHLYGLSADLDPLIEIADRHGLAVVEDAAQAHGATYKGKRIGAHGHAVTWSFYPGKNLGALGDGGAVTTNDPDLAARVRVLGNYGSAEKYVNPVQGVNSRLDPIHAAVLSVKLDHLDRWNDERRRVAAAYSRGLAGTTLVLPVTPNWAEPVWHQYVVRSAQRDALRDYLAAREIETLIHYPIPPHLQDAYAGLGMGAGSFPLAEQLAGEVLSLPIGPHVDQNAIDTVAAAVRDFEAGDGG